MATQLWHACTCYSVVAGGLPLLMATLDQVKCAAKYAFPVLRHLVDTGTLPAEEVQANEALVARMQGLRRCSTLLCPLYSQGQEDQLQRGALPRDSMQVLHLAIRVMSGYDGAQINS